MEIIETTQEIIDTEQSEEGKKKAREAISKLFNHLRIERIVGIDDENVREPSFEDFKILCIQLGEEACYTIKELQSIPFEPQQVLVAFLEELWNNFTEEDRNRVYEQLSNVPHEKNTRGDIDILEDLLDGHDFQELPLKEWRTKKQEFLEEAKKHRTLFLFDQNFFKEGGPLTGGIEIIQEILNPNSDYRDVVMCGLLSRTFAPNEEHILWEQFAKDYKIDQDRFILISKQRLHKDPLGFARMIKLTALNPECGKLKGEVAEVIDQAQREAAKNVENVNIYDFEHIVFQSSNNEGVWEPDTLFRLFGLFLRQIAREKAKSNVELYELAARIRSVASIPTHSVDAPKHTSWEIQRREIYEDVNHLNNFHIPLDLGDIFEKTSGGKKFILLAQPCDLMVRREGSRKPTVNEAIIAEINDLPKPPSSQKDKYIDMDAFYELPYFDQNTGKSRYVNFRKIHTVCLWVFDLCVYQTDGLAKFGIDDSCPTNIIPTWKLHYEEINKFVTKAYRRYQELQKRVSDREILSLVIPRSSNNNLFKGKVDLTEKSLGFDCRRIGRLCQPRAGAMLTKFASYLARAAFESDFGKEVEKDNSLHE